MRTSVRQSTSAAVVLLVAGAVGVGVAPQTFAAPVPRVDSTGRIPAPERTQISFTHSVTGVHLGTGNEHESRPALSIVKLYIADYVFAHGDPADQAAATRMLQTSDDAIASQLYARYPSSISDTAAAYGLGDTHTGAHWGDSTTSTADSVKYLEAKKRNDPASPVLSALATASPVAADGYHQDYGTAVLPGVIGTKWGWSDDRTSFHTSASFGADFSVAAATRGPAGQLTDDVRAAFEPSLPQLPDSLPLSLPVPLLPDISALLPALPEFPALPAFPG